MGSFNQTSTRPKRHPFAASPLETVTPAFQSRRPRTRTRPPLRNQEYISYQLQIVHITLAQRQTRFTNTDFLSESAIAHPSRVSVRLSVMHIHFDIVVVYLIRCQERVDPIVLVQKCRERLWESSAHR